MKIVFLTEYIDVVGGIERGLCARANYLVRKFNYEVLIFCTNKEAGQIFYDLDSRVKIIYLEKLISKKNFVERLYLQYQQSKKIISYNPNVIVSVKFSLHLFFFQILSKNIRLVSEIRESLSEYQNNIRSIKGKIYSLFRKYIYSKQDKIIILTKNDQVKWKLKNSIVIPNFIMINNDKISERNNCQVLSVGRLHEVKGYNYLIDAWKIVNKKYPKWKLKICGEGSEYSNLIQKVIKLNLHQSVTITNKSVNVIPEYLNSDFFALTSNYEAFGNVIVEAQSCGLPVISFDSPTGPKEIINDKIDGFIIPIYDIKKMADKIIYLIENPEIKNKMGQHAVENSKKFSIDNIMNKYITAIS